MAKRQVYSFEEKRFSANGVASAVLGTAAFLVLLVLLFVSFLMKGMANTWIGAAGFAGIVMACCGLGYGYISFRDECKSYLCSKLGIIMSALAVCGWFFIVCLGFAAG